MSVAAAWRDAARNPLIIRELEAIYKVIASEVSRRGPACWASGRCCNFEKTGHLLYVTGLEAAYTIARMRAHALIPAAPIAPLPDRTLALPLLTGPALEFSMSGGACPFQRGNLCTAREGRPLGCRIYFCDRTAQEWQHACTEQGLADLRALHERHGVAYEYGEWRRMLGLITALDEKPPRSAA